EQSSARWRRGRTFFEGHGQLKRERATGAGVRFERSTDVALIRQIITHPKIYPWLGDDGMPPAAQFQPVDHPEIHYMLVWDGSELLGLFEFRPKNSVTWEAHTCLLPNAWGARAVTAAREMARWTFDNTSCERIVTAVPEYNRL